MICFRAVLLVFVCYLVVQYGHSQHADNTSDHRHCRPNILYNIVRKPVDRVWLHYLNDVYNLRKQSLQSFGSHPSLGLEPKKDLHMIYKHKDIHFSARNPRKKYSEFLYFASADNYAVNYFSKVDRIIYPDNSFVEVTRSSTVCLSKYLGVKHYYEGYSSGYLAAYNGVEGRKIGYGCWFHPAKGSGVFINIGQSLVADSREDLANKLGLPCPDYHCFGSSHDTFYCQRALILGYDSIQTQLSVGDAVTPELIYCAGNCSSVSFNTTCPPIELRTGLNASVFCHCNNDYPILNCNDRITYPGDCACDPPSDLFNYERRMLALDCKTLGSLYNQTKFMPRFNYEALEPQNYRKARKTCVLERNLDKKDASFVLLIGNHLLSTGKSVRHKVESIQYALQKSFSRRDYDHNNYQHHHVHHQRHYHNRNHFTNHSNLDKLFVVDTASYSGTTLAKLHATLQNISLELNSLRFNVGPLRIADFGYFNTSQLEPSYRFYQSTYVLQSPQVNVGLIAPSREMLSAAESSDSGGQVLLHHVQDEALCLQKNASFVLLLLNDVDDRLVLSLSVNVVDYVHAIVVTSTYAADAEESTAQSGDACDGDWHDLSATGRNRALVFRLTAPDRQLLSLQVETRGNREMAISSKLLHFEVNTFTSEVRG